MADLRAALEEALAPLGYEVELVEARPEPGTVDITITVRRRSGATVDPPEAVAADATATAPDLSPAAAVAADTSPGAAAPDDTSPRAEDDTSRSSSDTSPGPGGDESPGSQRQVLPARPATTRVQAEEAKLQRRTSKARQEADERKADLTARLLAFLEEAGEATIQECAEALGVKVGNLTSLRVDLERRHIISWRRAKPGTEHPMYYRVPQGHEAEGVEITQATPGPTLKHDIRVALNVRAQNAFELAASVGAIHIAVVLQACSELEREGAIAKQPGGRYLLAA